MNFRNLTSLFLFHCITLTCVPLPVPAQDDGCLRAIVFLSGASSEEDLDDTETDKYMDYVTHPLEINLSGRSKLLASGLLSPFQVASIVDYRSRFGDILSVAELATLPGFGEGSADALRHFISLNSRSGPGIPFKDTLVIRQDAVARVAVRGKEYNYGMKYRIAGEGRFEVSMAARSYYGDRSLFPPANSSLCAVAYGRNRLGKIVLGDFNARFGQGLVQWSGMSLTGFSSSASFCRKANGITPSWSYAGTGSHRGEAADFRFGNFLLSQFVSFPGLRSWTEGSKKGMISVMPGANLTWFGRNGQAGVTWYYLSGPLDGPLYQAGGKLSADFRYNLKGVDCFGEYAYDFIGGCSAWIGGTSIPVGGEARFNAVFRDYPSAYAPGYSGGVRAWSGSAGERGLALGLERYSACLTVDIASRCGKDRQRQCKVLMMLPVQLSDNYILTIRMNERYRPDEPFLKYRTGARLDLDWSGSGLSARYGRSDLPAWKARLRAEGILCRSFAWLSYLECGRMTDSFSAYLRGTLFFIDNWDDRIYSYERDAPGNFTVPAYYGRGWSIGAYAGAKFPFGRKKYKALKLYFRASTVSYPFMKETKPGKTEVKFQAMVSL